MSRNNPWAAAVVDAIEVPDYIKACAHACYYDLMHGPSYVHIPRGDVTKFTDDDLATLYEDAEDECEDPADIVEETYTGKVGQALRAFIDDLPSEAWVDTDCGCYMESEPAQGEEVDGEWIEYDWSSMYHLDLSDIIEALFGRTIAREFR